MINPRDLETFLTCAASGTFAAAAVEIGASKASVTRSIKRLEDARAEDLFTKSGRSKALSPAGERLGALLLRSGTTKAEAAATVAAMPPAEVTAILEGVDGSNATPPPAEAPTSDSASPHKATAEAIDGSASEPPAADPVGGQNDLAPEATAERQADFQERNATEGVSPRFDASEAEVAEGRPTEKLQRGNQARPDETIGTEKPEASAGDSRAPQTEGPAIGRSQNPDGSGSANEDDASKKSEAIAALADADWTLSSPAAVPQELPPRPVPGPDGRSPIRIALPQHPVLAKRMRDELGRSVRITDYVLVPAVPWERVIADIRRGEIDMGFSWSAGREHSGYPRFLRARRLRQDDFNSVEVSTATASRVRSGDVKRFIGLGVIVPSVIGQASLDAALSATFAKGVLKRVDSVTLPHDGGRLTTTLAPLPSAGTERILLPEPFWTRAGLDAVYRADLPCDTHPTLFDALQRAFAWAPAPAANSSRRLSWWERLIAVLRG
jgi:DNA-binding transcriptional LysR family regulator